MGGYETVDISAINDAREYQEMEEVIQFAKGEYGKSNDEPLGRMASVSRQLVEGYNYKLLFEVVGGYVQIIVFDQTWTNTRQVTSITRLPN